MVGERAVGRPFKSVMYPGAGSKEKKYLDLLQARTRRPQIIGPRSLVRVIRKIDPTIPRHVAKGRYGLDRTQGRQNGGLETEPHREGREGRENRKCGKVNR